MTEYRCFLCNRIYQDHDNEPMDSIPCDCGHVAYRVHFYAPYVSKENLDSSFNPHYDYQLGEYFESLDHKKKWLEDNNYVQSSGSMSPQKDEPSRRICTKEQAQIHDTVGVNISDSQPRKIIVGA